MSPGYPYLVFWMIIRCLECKFPKGKFPHWCFIKFTLLTHLFVIIPHSNLNQIGQILFLHVHKINSDFSTSSEYFIFTGDNLISILQGIVTLFRCVGIILKLRLVRPKPLLHCLYCSSILPLSFSAQGSCKKCIQYLLILG